MRRFLYAVPVLGLWLSCAHAPPPLEKWATERPEFPAKTLMDVCWPEGASPTQKVRLVFERGGGNVKQVNFEALEGASVSTARCIRQVAFSYPWNWNEAPATMELSPPAGPPSGWVQLAFRRLVSQGLPTAARGVENPAPLVAACLKGQKARDNVRFVVQPHPVRVQLWMLEGQSWKEAAIETAAERCVAAVLGATPFPTRGFTFDFGPTHRSPPSAPEEQVNWYFPRAGARRPGVDPSAIQQVMGQLRPEVSSCWEETLSRRVGVGGGRTLHFEVGPKGEVEHAWVGANLSDADSEAVDYLFDACLVRALGKGRFVGTGKPALGVYSWVFASW